MEEYSRPGWFPDWSKETAVLVASGPSAKDVNLEIAKGKARFITTNDSWKLAPWADALYACDYDWWKVNNGCREFQGLRISADMEAIKQFDLCNIFCSRRSDWMDYDLKNNTIGWGGNSGFGALNIAVKFMAKRILLVGYDMSIKGGHHWHGLHPETLHNPTHNNTIRWRRALDAAAEGLRDHGVEVLNCSDVSALTQYRKVSFEEAFLAADQTV